MRLPEAGLRRVSAGMYAAGGGMRLRRGERQYVPLPAEIHCGLQSRNSFQGRRRMKRGFPTYQQLDAMDCGPTCLRIVAEHYGRRWSARTLRERCHTTHAGVSLLGISDAAESIGLGTAGVRLPW